MMESPRPGGDEDEDGAQADPRQALDAVDRAQRSVGEELVLPPGVDWLHGLGLGLTVAATGCLGALESSLATRIATPVLYLAALLVLWIALRRFRAANGVWFTSSVGPWRARIVWGVLTCLVTLLGIAAAISGASGHAWGAIVGAIVAVAAGVVFSRWWVALLRQGLAGTGAAARG